MDGELSALLERMRETNARLEAEHKRLVAREQMALTMEDVEACFRETWGPALPSMALEAFLGRCRVRLESKRERANVDEVECGARRTQ